MRSESERAAAVEETSGWIGRETVYDGVDEVSRNDIRRKLEVYCFDCPIHTDDAVARAHGYRMATAPAGLIPLWTLPAYWSPGDAPIFGPGLKEKDGSVRTPLPNLWKNGLNASNEVEFFEPVYPGDRLRTVTKLVEVSPKQTRLGYGAFLVYESVISKLSGEKVAVRRNTSFRYDADTRDAAGGRGGRGTQEADPATDVSAASPYNEPIDWSRQRHASDVRPGEDLPTYNVWLSYQRIVMSIAVDRMFSGIHHNRDFAREGGLDDIIFNTRGYDMTIELMLRRWIGLDGRIVKIGPFRMKGAGHPGDTLVCGGRVTGIETAGGRALVTLSIWVDSPRGRGTSGEAVISLPV